MPYIYNVHNFPLNFRSSGHLIFLLIQTFRTYITHTIFGWIFAALDIQFFGKSNNSVHIQCTQFPIEFSQFWIFNFSANPNLPYIYNVNNFPLNFRSCGDSILLEIQTFRIYIMCTISHWISLVLDIQFFCKFRNSVHI